MYIIALVLFFVCLIAVFTQTRSNSTLRPSFWLVIAYSFLLITHFFSGIDYFFGNIYRILPYFLSCLTLVLIGERLGRTIKSRPLLGYFKISSVKLGLFSIFGSALFIFDIIRLNEINFGTRIEDFSVSIVGVLGNMASSFGLLVWLTNLYHYRINKSRISLISYLCVISFVAGGVLSAGRQAIILVALSSVILMIWSSKRNKEAYAVSSELRDIKAPKPWGFYVILVLFLTYFMYISAIRSGISNIDNKIAVYEKGFSATTSSETKNIVHNAGGLADIYIEFAYYYSHQLIRLDLLYQNYDFHPLLGLGQMTYFERRLQWLFGKQGEESWKQVEIALEDKGRISSHTWSTFVADYIIDFGRVGALIACLITGLVFGVLFRKFKRNENSSTIVRQCLICGGVVFSIQFSPLAELIYFIPLFLSSFITIK